MKKIIDITIASLIFIIVSPVFLFIVIFLIIPNRGKVFFLQARPGKNKKIFKVIKFKTMNDKKDNNGILLPDRERLTFIGKFIRSTSLDEMPQLLNVIKGDMSLVGPRPLSIKYLNLYSEEQKRRHEILPGITGWAQINGRNNILWKKKFEYDVWYVDNQSLLLDIKILFLTVYKVINRTDVKAEGQSEVKSFNGNN